MKQTKDYIEGKESGLLTCKSHGVEWTRAYLAGKQRFMDRHGSTPSRVAAYWNGYKAGIKQAERHNKTREGKLWAKLESETCSLYQSTTWNHFKPNVKRSSRYLTRATAIMQKLAALEAK